MRLQPTASGARLRSLNSAEKPMRRAETVRQCVWPETFRTQRTPAPSVLQHSRITSCMRKHSLETHFDTSGQTVAWQRLQLMA